jgi:uncharacterized membrane protein
MTPRETQLTHLVLLVSVLPIIAVALVMALGRVKRNPYVGFRTPATLSDDRIWDPANRYAGRALLVAALSHVLVVALNLAGILQLHVLATIVLLLAALVAAFTLSMVRLRRIVRSAKPYAGPGAN